MKNTKKLTLTSLFVLFVLSVFSQDISGSWQGALKIQAMQLRLVVNITKADDGYTSTLDSPDQGAKGIPVTTTSFKNDTLKFSVANLGADYVGVLKQDTITGTFTQMGRPFPLQLARGKVELNRPQEPTKPYPYYEEEVTFENKEAGIKLAGTLTLPKKEGLYPVVILISGSGPQNRNEELMGHKPFLVLADHLTRNGIAVLRYDDRGVGQSTGDFGAATSLDFSTDVEAGVQYLKTRKEINPKQIGLMGHSEGGVIAPMVAARSKDVAFIVLLAGTGVNGEEILIAQQKLIGKAMGADDSALEKSAIINKGAFDLVKNSKDIETLKTDLAEYLKENGAPESSISTTVNQIATPWMKYFMVYDPGVSLVKVNCPVLSLNGEKDLQVPSQQNLEAIKSSLAKAKNKNVTTKELAGLNHLFQECKTGAPTEYGTIEQTFSPVALNEISNWINGLVKK
jgi:pimeloyl-ACP methyl ester carboxylesterase